MTLDLVRILRSKRDLRQRLAARPVAEKLAMLDAMRERALAIRPTPYAVEGGLLREKPPPDHVHGKKAE